MGRKDGIQLLCVIYLVELGGVATALAGSVVVNVGLGALLGIALLNVDIGVAADHYGSRLLSSC